MAIAVNQGYEPCAREQEGLWLLEQSRDIGVANNLSVGIRLHGAVDPDVLNRAFGELIRAHPALRTEFAFRDGRLQRRVRDLDELGGAPAMRVLPGRKEDLPALLRQLTSAHLDVLHWPAFEATLIRHGDRDHLFFGVFHHAIFDGVSRRVLLDDLAELYTELLSGRPPSARPTGDAPRTREQDAVAGLDGIAAAYWRAHLPRLETAGRLPSLRDDPAGGGEEEMVCFSLDPELTRQVEELATAQGVSTFVALLGALQTLQLRYGQDAADAGVATSIAMDTRAREERQRIGMYANEAPLCMHPDPMLGFDEHLQQVGAAARALLKLRRFPFTEALSRWATRSPGASSPAEVGISYVRTNRRSTRMGDVDAELLAFAPAYGSRRAVTLYLVHLADRIDARLKFDPAQVSMRVAERAATHYVTLLRSACASPRTPIGRLTMLAPDEWRDVTQRLSRSDAPFDDSSPMHEVVERQVRRTPEAPALSRDGAEVSYAELNARANRLAHRLRELGVGPDVPVALCAERTPDLVTGLLAILKAGGAYLPLDPEYPARRLGLMLQQGRPGVLLADRHLMSRLPSESPAQLLLLDEPLSGEPETDPLPSARAEHLAYILFTSGSTGVPKAVAMPRGPLRNLLAWQCRSFALDGPRRVLQFTSPSFDVSFVEMLSTLMTGGCLVLTDDDRRKDLDRLASFILNERIERIFVPPFVMSQLAEGFARSQVSGPLEAISAGEQLEITDAIRIAWSRSPRWTVENQYGPTETHVTTANRLTGPPASWPVLPSIGRPIPGARIYVLDRLGQPVPVGVPGELFIAGPVLARGYLGRPELTVARFLDDRFVAGERMYRTGDLARWRLDGSLQCLGRVDRQVKIRGHRIELGEIESALMAHPAVRDAVVEARDDSRVGGRHLVAYLVHGGGPPPTGGELRAYVKQTLPDFMVPRAFVELRRLPLTPNGKVDRAALPEPTVDDVAAESRTAARTDTERALADIWSDLLDLDGVGIDDDFFGLGGDSLLAAAVVSRTRAAFDVDIPVRVVFADPTIRALAGAVHDAKEAASGPGAWRAPRRPLVEQRPER